MFDYMVQEHANGQQHQEDIRQAEHERLVRAVRAQNRAASPRIATPVRRAAQLVGALIR